MKANEIHYFSNLFW